MSGKKTVTTDTFLRELPFSVVRGLSVLLDLDDLWKDFVVTIPRQLDSDHFEPRYSHISIRCFAQRLLKQNGSPTNSIIEDWGTQNARLRHLLTALREARLYASITYLENQLGLSSKQQSEIPDRTMHNEHASNRGTSTDNNLQVQYDREKKPLAEVKVENISPKVQLASSERVLGGGESLVNHIVSFDSEQGDSVGTVDSCQSPRVPKENVDRQFPQDDLSLKEAPYSLLATITNNFDDLPLTQGGRIIGCGGFGHVFLGEFSNGYKVAVKRLINNDDLNMDKQFVTELKTLSTYRHINIVSILGYSRDNVHRCLVYEFMENGSLEDRLACKDGSKPLGALVRMTIAKGTACGINFLHSKGLIHRDIKSANVLLDAEFTAKVGDFATVRAGPRGTMTTSQSTSVVIGTSAYLAPEATRFDVSSKLDSFSFGIVLLELLTGLEPFDNDREDMDLLTHVESKAQDDGILSLIDDTAGPWDEVDINCLFEMATKCTEMKKIHRALIEEILPDFAKLNLEDNCSNA